MEAKIVSIAPEALRFDLREAVIDEDQCKLSSRAIR